MGIRLRCSERELFRMARTMPCDCPCDDPGLLPTVQAHLLTVRQHDTLEPDDLLAVGELISGACDHVSWLDGRLVPAVRFHPVNRGPTDQPLLHLALIRLDLERDHWVRVLPGELHHGAFHCDQLPVTHRPRVM